MEDDEESECIVEGEQVGLAAHDERGRDENDDRGDEKRVHRRAHHRHLVYSAEGEMMLDAVFDVVGTVESSVLGSCALRLGAGV